MDKIRTVCSIIQVLIGITALRLFMVANHVTLHQLFHR